MKKLLALSAVLAFGLTACGKDNSSSSVSSSNAGSSTSSSSVVAPATEKVNVGVGYHVSWNETNQVDFTAAMVAFDAEGKVAGARIDVVQVLVVANETNDGVVISATHPDTYANAGLNEDGTIKTKLELGSDYAMAGKVDKNGDGVMLEVDAQIETYAKWTVGKTVEEIKAGEGLDSTCTITVSAFAAAVESAYSLKSETTYDVAPDFTTGVAINANLYNPTTLDFDLGGAIVVDNKAVAASVDCVAVEFTVAEGAVSLKEGSHYVNAETGAFLSKKTLGSDYGMAGKVDKNGDGIMLEWFEQAAVIENACVGKTTTEIAALTQATGELATATMNCGTYIAATAKAVKYAPMTQIGPKAA